MEWIKKELTRWRENALEEVGRYKGKAEAYADTLELFDPDKRCQACGCSFYSPDSKNRHYKDHPDHLPAAGATTE